MSRFGKMNDTTDHQYVEDRLSAYLDGELPAREKEAVNRHLAACQACRWQLGTLRQTVQWMEELPAVPVPRVFTIPAPAQPVPRRRWNFVPLLQGAAALIALTLVVMVAGDLFLTSFAPRAVPQSAYYLEGAPALPQATMAVLAGDEAPVAEAEVVMEEEAAAPPALDVMPTLESVATQAEALAREHAAEKSSAPTSPTEAPMMSAAAPPPPPEGVGATVEEEAAEEPLAPQIVAPEADTAALDSAEPRTSPMPTAVWTATAAAEVDGTATPDSAEPRPSIMPTAVWTATIVAEIEETVPIAQGAGAEQPAGALRRPSVSWLRVVEVGLAVALALILPVTIIAMVQRRRSR